MSLLLAALLTAAPTQLDCGGTPCRTFRTAKQAFAQVLAEKPAVLGVGEYHQLEGQPKVPSAVKRFTRELLPSLKGKAGSLIVETWMLNGRCGQVEQQAAQEVKETTKRPDETEDEVTTLLHRAHDLGLKNHILMLTCDDYRAMLDEAGELDALKTLTMVKQKVEEKALDVRRVGEAGTRESLLLLFGGALHNDLHPSADDLPFAFGPALKGATEGGYVELDLLVPEFVREDKELAAQPWFAPALEQSAKGRVVLLSPGEGSWVLLFPTTKPARPAPR